MKPRDPAWLTMEELRRVLHYDPSTGIFIWLVLSNNNGCKPGDVAGYRCSQYIAVTLRGHQIKAHRLAFFYMKGHWPVADVDHENLDSCDNRWSNLRPATRSLNCANKRVRRDSASGLKGVHRRRDRYLASISDAGKRLHLGCFDTAEAAHAAYVTKARELFGEFARAA